MRYSATCSRPTAIACSTTGGRRLVGRTGVRGLELDHLVGQRQTAEDLTQEVFLRVYRARKTYSPDARFSTWIYRIAHNVASNWLRTHSRRREVRAPAANVGDTDEISLEQLAKDAAGARQVSQELRDTAAREPGN